MKFWKIESEYLNIIQNIDPNIIQQNNTIGIIYRLNGFIYFLPIVELNSSDFEENGVLKSSVPTIMRISDHHNTPLCKCLFSNMFPVPYNTLESYSFTTLDQKYKSLQNDKLTALIKQNDRIEKSIRRIYKQKSNNYSIPYLNHTVDFKKLEYFVLEYENKNYGKHINRFPDDQYFIENPYTLGISEYYLMNKNTKVLKIEFNNEIQQVTKILEILNSSYAPLECFDHEQITREAITKWFKGRGIPSWRDGLDDLLDSLNIKDKDILLNKAFGLSLSDQYWFNPVNTPLDWNDINFFENHFNGYSYYQIIFKDELIPPNKIDFFSPNNTSDGMLKKAWIIENNKRILVKGSYKGSQLEPFNEVLASKISSNLGLPHVDYTLDFINNASVSKCECFIQSNTELITAYSILKYYGIDGNQKAHKVYKDYLQILEKHHIVDAKEKLAKMFILDYLMVNKDRHLGNFGIIRNVETLEWIDIAPNFDNGQSLYSQNISYYSDFNYPKGKFFFDNALSFDAILEIVLNDISISIDFESLYQLVEEWKELLTQYQETVNLDDETIVFLVQGFKTRIDCLKEHF